MIQKKARKVLLTIVILYVITGLGLYFFQEKFLFHPKPLPSSHQFSFAIPFKEINIPFSANKTLSMVQFTVTDSVRKGIVLYFHGNRQNVERYAPFAKNFIRQGYEVWMPDYPGFGKSTGELSELALYADALEVYKMARAKISKDSIIIYGKSLGSGIASQLASVRDCKRLILETPYASIPSLASHYAFIYPVSWMAKYKMPTIDYLNTITAPITVFHGDKDEVISYSEAEKLKKAKPGIELIQIENGKHNNLNDFPLFQQTLDSLLSEKANSSEQLLE